MGRLVVAEMVRLRLGVGVANGAEGVGMVDWVVPVIVVDELEVGVFESGDEGEGFLTQVRD
jgi:hypothetical protein